VVGNMQKADHEKRNEHLSERVCAGDMPVAQCRPFGSDYANSRKPERPMAGGVVSLMDGCLLRMNDNREMLRSRTWFFPMKKIQMNAA
jgi:hypothetical protein